MAAPRQRQLSRWDRALERVAASRPGGWFFVNVANRIDPPLLRLTRGRLSLAVGQPVLLLTTRGAKSGRVRRTPLLYATDGEDVVLIASNAGSVRHPAWYHNVRADPRVELQLPGRRGAYVAREAAGAERERLWAKATDLYSGYDVYQRRAGAREIPVVVLSPAEKAKPASP